VAQRVLTESPMRKRGVAGLVCLLLGGVLVGAPAAAGAGCAADDACREAGRCTLIGDRCLVGGDADCRRAVVCLEQGRCSVDDRGKKCVARHVEDCRASRRCTEKGRCFLDADAERCDNGTEPHSPALLYTGVSIVALGAAGIVAGSLALLLGGVDGGLHDDFGDPAAVAGALGIGIGASLALSIGTPLAAIGGAREQRPDGREELQFRLQLAPTGAAFRVDY
jgi:hypothetical protein